MGNDLFTTSTTAGNRESTTHYALSKLSKELVDQAHSGTDLQALDEKVKSMRWGLWQTRKWNANTGKIIYLQTVWQKRPLDADKKSH